MFRFWFTEYIETILSFYWFFICHHSQLTGRDQSIYRSKELTFKLNTELLFTCVTDCLCFPIGISSWHLRPVNFCRDIFIRTTLCIVPEFVVHIHPVRGRDDNNFSGFTRRNSRINRTKKLICNVVRNEREFVQKYDVKRHTPDSTSTSRCSKEFTSVLQFH